MFIPDSRVRKYERTMEMLSNLLHKRGVSSGWAGYLLIVMIIFVKLFRKFEQESRTTFGGY